MFSPALANPWLRNLPFFFSRNDEEIWISNVVVRLDTANGAVGDDDGLTRNVCWRTNTLRGKQT